MSRRAEYWLPQVRRGQQRIRGRQKTTVARSLIELPLHPQLGTGAAGSHPLNLIARAGLQRNHSITSSAAVCNVSGTVGPSALAVLRLMISSNLLGFGTGRSAGFSPFNMRCTYA